MGTQTAIAWTDHTFNPWVGCTRVSPGCEHCYAEALTKRTGMAVWGKNGTRTVTSDGYWKQPHRWDRMAADAGRPGLVFCASLADVFEDRDDLYEPRHRLFDLIGQTPHLIWQLLTKRPENVLDMVPWEFSGWPDNVWLGATVEDQHQAHLRLPKLLAAPAAVRFLSCEPLLGYITLADSLGGIGWVIVGGESGPGHRPLVLDHARHLVAQVKAAGIPVFFKQVGGPRPTSGGDELDGRTIKQFPPQAMR